MLRSDLTASDVLAMTSRNNDTLFGGNGSGFIILILFFLSMGNGFGFGNNYANGAWNNGSLTRAELADSQAFQNLQYSTSNIKDTVTNGFAGIQQSLCGGFAGVNASISDLGYRMQNCCCELKTAIHSEGEATRALIQANTIQDLRDKVADKDRELLATGLVTAQTIQTNNLQNFMRTLVNGCSC